MHPSTTAIITVTDLQTGYFYKYTCSDFFMDLCVYWNTCHEYYYFASLGIFMHEGCRMQRLTKSLHIFCMDKRLLEDFVLKCNQWKYWMSFVACGCHLSRSHTVGYWAFGHTKQCNDFPEWPPNSSLLLP